MVAVSSALARSANAAFGFVGPKPFSIGKEPRRRPLLRQG